MSVDLATADEEARRRLIEDLDTCLFVEAGAGTGKTTSMVARITALVAVGRATAQTLVAITFTEAAAGELRSRVREALETAALDPGRPDAERARCQRAAEELDLAMISTIHSFAAELLRAFPLEAGCPPRLNVLDPTAELVARRESFTTWFELAATGPWREAVSHALQLGMSRATMERLAGALSSEWDVLTPKTQWTLATAADVVGVAGETGATIRELGDGSGLPDHKWTVALVRAQLAGERCRQATTVEDAVSALRLVEALPRIEGNQGDFNAAGGIPEQGRRIKAALTEAKKAATEALATLRVKAMSTLLPHLRDWILADVAQRRRDGTPTFQDLLAWARTLLQRADVRATCRARWSHIIVDEFQDTDPLQAELAVLLSAVPEHDPATVPWVNAQLIPGRLCVVGDPKQSIYRFRRADIALYEYVRDTIGHSGGDTVSLSRNFRSVPKIIDVVNSHFTDAMVASPGVQPEYVPLHAHCEDHGDGVWVMGDVVDGNAGDVWALEAQAVAQACRRIHDEGWEIRDPAKGPRRPVAFSDICILVPTRTNVRRLEQAFESTGVPYRLESGALILETQDVRDLLSTLRAIDDPSNQVALVAALRSPAYGCTDLELHHWVSTGGRLNALRPGDGDVQRIREALADIAARHARRHDGSVAAMVERFIADRMVDVAAYQDRRPREVLRRLRWVANQARAIAASGLTSLRETVDLMESLDSDAPRSSSGAATETDEDSVRVLTVHGAKGLEFPVVMMTGLGSDPNLRTEPVLVDRLGGVINARVGGDPKGASFETPGYPDAKEIETDLAKAERQRLLYVAATRARDHLLISVFRTAKRGEDADAFAATLQAAVAAGSARDFAGVEPLGDVSGEPTASTETVADSVAADLAWMDAREQLLVERSAEEIRSATSIAHESDAEDVEQVDVTAFRRGRGGTALGRAVHAVLQFVPLDDKTAIADLARVQAAVEGIPDRADRVAELAQRAWASEPMRRAAASKRCWREVPVGAMLDDVLTEGFIDLLYQDGDALVVADYKTDDVAGAEVDRRMKRYLVQGDVYARLLATVTGMAVDRCEFIFAAAGEVRTIAYTRPLRPWP